MHRTVIAALLLAAAPALAAEKPAPWKPAWYQVEIFPDVKYSQETFADKATCEKAIEPSHDMLVVCAHLTKAEDTLDAAIAGFTGMIKKQPKAVVLINQRGNLYMHKGDVTRAVADYTRAIKLEPNDFWGYALRAAAYEKTNKRAKAIADYKAALARHPDEGMQKSIQAALKTLGAS